MGNCLGSPSDDGVDPEVKKQAKKIDKDLLDVKDSDAKTHKLLLLGAGDSGKSTLFKQMLYTFGNGYTEEDYLIFKEVIYCNINTSINTLCAKCEKCGGLPLVAPDVLPLIKECIDNGAQIHPNNVNYQLGAERIEQIKKIWSDPGIQHTYTQKNKYQLQESCEYFISRIDQLSKKDYVPSFDDVLRTRAPTTGIIETEFSIRNVNFKMMDVGGQRSERKKWIHCFDSVTAVLFVASISEYDQVLYEDEMQNRMVEALNLFEEICNSEWFDKTSIILFLNKRDIFEEKIKTTKFSDYFEEYEGDDSKEDVEMYIKEMFVERNRQDKDIFVHTTCATDTSQIEVVFLAVKDTVLKGILHISGML